MRACHPSRPPPPHLLHRRPHRQAAGRGQQTAPLRARGLAAPRLYEHVGKERKDALADEFDGGLIGARVEVDRRVRDGVLSVFADACAAKDDERAAASEDRRGRGTERERRGREILAVKFRAQMRGGIYQR